MAYDLAKPHARFDRELADFGGDDKFLRGDLLDEELDGLTRCGEPFRIGRADAPLDLARARPRTASNRTIGENLTPSVACSMHSASFS